MVLPQEDKKCNALILCILSITPSPEGAGLAKAPHVPKRLVSVAADNIRAFREGNPINVVN